MKDRIVQYPNRYRDKNTGQIFDLEPYPGTVSEVGTPLNKGTLLSDESAMLCGLNVTTATVSEAISRSILGDDGVMVTLQTHYNNKPLDSGIVYTLYNSVGTVITTIVGDGIRTTVRVVLPYGTYTIKCTNKLDYVGYTFADKSFTLSKSNGLFLNVGFLALDTVGLNSYISTSCTKKIVAGVSTYQLCLIAGGGGGSGGVRSHGRGAGGAGAYLVNTVNLPRIASIVITIGAGGVGSAGVDTTGGSTTNGGTGGQTVVKAGSATYNAAGGAGGGASASKYGGNGGNGGTGGGGGASNVYQQYGGTGGTNGATGGNGGNSSAGNQGMGGTGDGKSKYPFGLTSHKICCAGGGGGGNGVAAGSDVTTFVGKGGNLGGGDGGSWCGNPLDAATTTPGKNATYYGAGGGGGGSNGGNGFAGLVVFRAIN